MILAEQELLLVATPEEPIPHTLVQRKSRFLHRIHELICPTDAAYVRVATVDLDQHLTMPSRIRLDIVNQSAGPQYPVQVR